VCRVAIAAGLSQHLPRRASKLNREGSERAPSLKRSSANYAQRLGRRRR